MISLSDWPCTMLHPPWICHANRAIKVRWVFSAHVLADGPHVSSYAQEMAKLRSEVPCLHIAVIVASRSPSTSGKHVAEAAGRAVAQP
mmetsp:Transcript_356/g.1143  ORF Transcript_356/g.1143 Transcript_356/m.1143 type:complete len:88 (-) Transcript_356:1275-1538(-)